MQPLDLKAGFLSAATIVLLLSAAQPPAAQAQVFPTSLCAGPVGTTLPQTCVTAHQGSSVTACDTTSCEQVQLDNIAGHPGNVLNTGKDGNPPTTLAAADALYWGNKRVLTTGDEGAGNGLDADSLDGQDSTFMVPSGAVMAFDLSTCPSGWTAFTSAAGRNIIGTGTGSGLTARTLGQTGGEESHFLTTDQMPAHEHVLPMVMVYGGHTSGGMPYWTDYTGETTDSYSAGGDQAHNVMDPYIALLYCKKT